MTNHQKNTFPFLEVKDVSTEVDGNWVLKNINFYVSDGERVVIMGETGSGKSTLLKVIAGLEMCDKGAVFVDGITLKGPQDQLIPGNPGICYMNQHAVLRNNYKIHEILDRHRALNQEDADQLYQDMGITHLMHRWSDEASGGEKQRVLLASLLVTKPKILLLDEPFSNLDQINKSVMWNVIDRFVQSYGMLVVLATHDPSDIWNRAEALMILQNGLVVDFDEPRNIYFNPSTHYVAGLLGDYQLIPAYHPLNHLFEESDSVQDLIVRPSHFLCKKKLSVKKAIKGSVIGIQSFDHYRMLEIEIHHFNLKVSVALHEQFEQGDQVFVENAFEYFPYEDINT